MRGQHVRRHVGLDGALVAVPQVLGRMTDSRNDRAGVLRFVVSTRSFTLRAPAADGHLAQVGHDPVLDAAAQHAAAQEERVEVPRLVAALGDDQADQAVVAEAVPHADRADLVPAAGGQRLHVGFLATDGGEVELVGAQRQLRRPAQVLVG